jgi:transposase
MESLRRQTERIADMEPGKEFKVSRASLTDEEMSKLMKELNRMMLLTQSRDMRKLITYHIGYVVLAAEAAKKYFEPKSFGGRYAIDTQFGVDFIRPGMLGKRKNQTFVQLPFSKLINQIAYKSDEKGIEVREQDEYHTSKCSFLDNEPIEQRAEYVGRRKSRGLFRSGAGI